jgi:hypothetical protein
LKRIKKHTKDLGLKVWTQTIHFTCEKGVWHERAYATAQNEEQAKELVESYAGNKTEIFPIQIDCSIQEDFELNERKPTSIKPSVYGQIIWMSQEDELQKLF